MRKILLIVFFLVVSVGLIGKTNPNQKQYNFFYFSKHLKTPNTENDSLTPPFLKASPDYGVLPLKSPCENCLELLDHRDATSRYFTENKT